MEINGVVPLGGGYQFYAPGMVGQLEMVDERPEAGPSAGGAIGPAGDPGPTALNTALSENFYRVRTVVVDASQVRPLQRMELRPSDTAGTMHQPRKIRLSPCGRVAS